MKALAAISLLICIFIQSFSTSLVLLEFKINQAYIAEQLCEKKDMPESGCKGKCQLKKSLAENHQQSQEQQAGQAVQLVLFINALLETERILLPMNQQDYCELILRFPAPPLHAIFHPPSSGSAS